MPYLKERPMRFLRISIGEVIVPAEILSDTSSGYMLSLWVPGHKSVHDGRWIPGERKIKHIYHEDHRIKDVDDIEEPQWHGNIVDIFIAREQLILKRLG